MQGIVDPTEGAPPVEAHNEDEFINPAGLSHSVASGRPVAEALTLLEATALGEG